ncbi:MetQ/NlpA family ABC transporter substrate-binding protein [Helicobacter equorum]|uniref:MetQ/NlpA family ABC transporter substrate-binding protein n=1 Tax=Helicobacter equorum TaxID=361872 RepID=UPI000CF08383|nr:MetQ/NlpA family ABC transporter substrate-binding protein [Helicobacter equorum]
MKRQYILACVASVFMLFSGCGENTQNETQKEIVELKVGATPVPHAQILEAIKEDLQKEGIRLKIVEFSDYVTPNLSLNDGSLDANFFQHKPYLYAMNKERKLDLVDVADIHIEPIGLYSTKIHDIADLEQNNTIAIPNDPTNGGRALMLLHNKGLITLKDPSNLASTEADIIENPKDLKIVSVEAALLPRIIKEYDVAVINSNFAIPAGFTSKDALIVEDRSSPYVNVLVVKANNVDNPHILTLKKVLQSPKVKEFIEQTYNGELVPVF